MMSFSRRRLLQSLGLGAGAALFAPFLRQAFADGNTPRRFVLVVEGNGIYPYSFLSTQARAAIDAKAKKPIGDELLCFKSYNHDAPIEVAQDKLASAKCLDPLAASGSEISLENRAAVVLGLSSTVTGGGHSTGFGALSCARAVYSPAGPTIDAVVGEKVKQSTPFDVLRLGVHADRGARLSYESCAFGAGKAAPIVVNPFVAYNSLFGSVASGDGQVVFKEQQSLLDFASKDVNRVLQGLGSSSPERAKIERYLAGVEALRQRQKKLIELHDTLASVRPSDPSTNPLYAKDVQPLTWMEAQFELATAALLGGLTNVAVLATATGEGGFGYTDTDIYPDLGRHEVQHGVLADDDAFSASCRAAVAQATRRQVQMIARMARTLAATPEAGGGGSMLDHTVIVYLSDNGEQHHSEAREWPVLLVGGNALGFKTDGRTIVYPAEGNAHNRQISNLFNTLGHAAGDSSLNAFGLEGASRIAEGPLSELWT